MKNKRFKAIAIAAITALTMLATPLSAFASDTSKNPTILNDKAMGSITIHKLDDKVWSDEKSTLKGKQEQYKATGEASEDLNNQANNYGIEGVTFIGARLGSIVTYQHKDNKGAIVTELAYEVPNKVAEILFGDHYNEYVIQDIELQAAVGKQYYKASTLTGKTTALTVAQRNDIKAYIENEQNTQINKTTKTTDQNGQAIFEDLPLGLYIVDESKVPANVVKAEGPFFVSVPMTNADGDNWNYNIHVYPKNKTESTNINKSVRRENDVDSITFDDSTTAGIGEIVDYRISTKIPTIEVGNKASELSKWIYTDTLDKGLDYVLTDEKPVVSVEIYSFENAEGTLKNELPTTKETLVATTDYTLTFDKDLPRTFSIKFTESFLKKMNEARQSGSDNTQTSTSTYTGKYIVVSYSATVNKDAILGADGNDNKATLEYSRSDKDDSEKFEDKTRVYTYGISLKKLFSETDDAKNENWQQVKFTLKDANGDYIILSERKSSSGVRKVMGTTKGYALKDGKWLNKDGQALNIEENQWHISPIYQGTCEIEGLAAGSYTLTETSTAKGYSLLKNPISIVIQRAVGTDKSTATKATATVDNKTVDMTAYVITAEQVDSAEAYVPLEVVNTKSWIPNLPLTGGTGTTMVVLFGALIAGFAIYVAASKKQLH